MDLPRYPPCITNESILASYKSATITNYHLQGFLISLVTIYVTCAHPLNLSLVGRRLQWICTSSSYLLSSLVICASDSLLSELLSHSVTSCQFSTPLISLADKILILPLSPQSVLTVSLTWLVVGSIIQKNLYLVGTSGLEPELQQPKCWVLPLHYVPKLISCK